MNRWLSIGRSASVVTLLAVLSTLGSPGSAAAQTGGSAPLGELLEITPWITPGDTWVARFAVTPALPPGAFVNVTIHAALGGTDSTIAERIDAQDVGDELGRVLITRPPVRVLELIEPTNSIRISVPVAPNDGEGDGVSLPTPGVYPVSISIEDDSGTELGTNVVHLIVDRARSSNASGDANPPLRAIVLVRSDSADAYRPDTGAPDIESARRMAQRLVDILAGSTSDDISAMLTLLRSETLEALASSTDPSDGFLLNSVVAAINRTRALKAPWARTHVAGWLNQGGIGEIDRSMIAAQDAARTLAGQILDPRVWPPDDTVSTNSLSGLGRLGVNQFLVDDSRLGEVRPPRGERGFNRPIRIGSSDTNRPAFVADPELAAVLTAPTEAPLSAHRAVTRLAAQTLSVTAPRRGDAQRAALVVIDDRVPTVTGTALLAALTKRGSGPIVVTPPEEVFSAVDPLGRNADGTGPALLRSMDVAANAPAVGQIATALPEAWARAESTRRMRPAGDAMAGQLRVDLLGVTRRSASSMQRQAAFDRARAATDDTLNAVDAPARRTVTVTSRQTTIPLRLTNRLDVAVAVQVSFESPRLQFREGERVDTVLQPGVNRFDVPVTVRSSGVFVLRVRVTPPRPESSGRSPDDVTLATSAVTVRSTAFSGVGLILSGGALLVLVVWWGRTLRHREPDAPNGDAPSPHPEPGLGEGVTAAQETVPSQHGSPR